MTDSPLEQKAVEIISQIQYLAPKATALALQAAQINAWSSLLDGVLWLAVFVATVIFWRKVYGPWVRRDDQDSMDGPIASFGAGAVLVILLGISGVCAINYLGDLWTYIGIFHPELALAHKII